MMLQSTPTRGFFSTLVVLALLVLETVAVVTTGASGSGVRREIRDLVADKTSWYLYIQAMAQLQSTTQGSLSSWYQLSGIHGRPQVSYDGVGGVANPENPGYCTHVSNLFTTWHRPFLALFEQNLVAAAISIAAKYPTSTRATYQAAATKLRLPYYDWAKTPPSSGEFPSAFTSETATIVTPTGSKTVKNPLFSYNFHPNPGDLYYQPFTYWNNTLRWPTSDSDVNAESQNDQSAANMASWQPSLKDRLYTLLTNYPQYNQFSNEAWITNSNTQDSLESVHDVVHGAIGGSNYGHMSIIDVSAFDATFWMHHAMVDRAFALWQAVNPNSWFQQQTQVQGSYWYASGYVTKSNTPLKPFKSDSAGTFWTSDSVRDWTKFGYTYPELPSGYTAASVRSSINKLYGSSTASAKVKRSAIGSAISNLRARFPGAMPDVSLAGTSETVRDYMANIRAQKNAIGESYFIYFFLGDYPSEPTQWSKDSSFVAANPIISALKSDDQMKDIKPIIVGASVPLNTALVKKQKSGELKSLNEKDVTAYLTANLHWEVQASNGTVLNKDGVPNLLISVASTKVKPAESDDQFPQRYGAATIHTGVTQNKPAGLCQKELNLYTNKTTTST